MIIIRIVIIIRIMIIIIVYTLIFNYIILIIIGTMDIVYRWHMLIILLFLLGVCFTVHDSLRRHSIKTCIDFIIECVGFGRLCN